MTNILLLLILLASACTIAFAEEGRLPIPHGVTRLSTFATSASTVAFTTPRNVFTAPSLGDAWTRHRLSDLQRNIDLVRVAGDTIELLATHGTASQPQRTLWQSSNGGRTWVATLSLPSYVGHVLAVVPTAIVCANSSDAVSAVVTVIHRVTGDVKNYATPFPAGSLLQGALVNDTIIIGASRENSAMGVLNVGNVSDSVEWITLFNEQTARRPYTLGNSAKTLLTTEGLEISEADSTVFVPLPKALDQTMCIEPELVVAVQGTLVMTFLGQVYQYSAQTRAWRIMRYGPRAGSVGIAVVNDTLVIFPEGQYPVFSTALADILDYHTLGPNIADVPVQRLRQTDEEILLAGHATVTNGQQRAGIVRWTPNDANVYDVVDFDPAMPPRVVGLGSSRSPRDVWVDAGGLALLSVDSNVVTPVAGLRNGEIPLTAGTTGDADIVVTMARVLRRQASEQEWQTVVVIGEQPWADAVMRNDTVWLFSLDPGITSEDNVLNASVVVNGSLRISMREVRRARDASVYRWSVPIPGGVLVDAGGAMRMSKDGGESWIPLPAPATDMVPPVLRGALMWSAGLVNGQAAILTSGDYGVTWARYPAEIYPGESPLSIAVFSDWIVLTATDGVYQFRLHQLSVHVQPIDSHVLPSTIVDYLGREFGKVQSVNTLGLMDGWYGLFDGKRVTPIVVCDGVVYWATNRLVPATLLP